MQMINERSRFEERHVLYCDLLGFSKYSLSEFFEPAKCFQLFAQLDRILADVSVKIDASLPDPRCSRPPDYVVNPEAIYFSDTIVISTPPTNVDAIWLCEAAARIQNYICLHSFLVRGAIVTGNVYHSGNTIFGPAIARAVALDSHGSPPVIIVSDETLEIFTRATSDTDKEIVRIREYQLIARDGSAKPYVDPFWLTKIHAEQQSVGESTRRNIESWRALIDRGLKSIEPAILEKYRWMAKKFNRCFMGKPAAIKCIDLQGDDDEETVSVMQ
jgi:hypothetical protein